jgi:hypothetical protein
MAGFSTGAVNLDNNYTSLSHAFYAAGNNIYIYENGGNVANLGPMFASDIFTIEVLNSAVEYRRNGIPVRTVAKTGTPVFKFDCSLYQTNSQVHLYNQCVSPILPFKIPVQTQSGTMYVDFKG